MTTIKLTPAEVTAWADVPEGGTFWLLREGVRQYVGLKPMPSTPPAEFVQACAPCEVCTGTRHLHPAVSGDLHPMPCQVCRIELVGPCPTCLGKTGWHGRDVPRTGVHNADRWFPCNRCRADHYSAPTGTVILGHAYAVGQRQQTDDGKWAVELRRA